MTVKWKDETSYSQTEKEPRTPRTWRADFPNLRVSVHRYHGLNGWFLTCAELHLEAEALKPEDVEPARIQALAKVQIRLEQKIKSYSAAIEKITTPPKETKD